MEEGGERREEGGREGGGDGVSESLTPATVEEQECVRRGEDVITI